MLQLIGLLGLSWLLVWVFEKRNLSVLGIAPSKDRMSYFIILFSVSAFISASSFLLRSYIAKEHYVLSPTFTMSSFWIEVWYQVRTVLTEELICRGALLYILIKRIGPKKAILFSSVFFALLHWLNPGVWGNPMLMISIFLFTFSMGLLLAYSYAKTFSILIPFAIHFGWNIIQNYIFPDTTTGNHVFVLESTPPSVTISYFAFFVLLILPKLALIVFNFLILKRHKQIPIS